MINEMIVFDILCAVLVTVLLLEVAGLFFVQYRKSRETLSLLLTICFCGFSGSSIFYFLRFFVLSDPSFYRVEVTLRFIAFATFIYMFEHKVKKWRFPFLTLYCVVCIIAILTLPYTIAYISGFTIYGAALGVFWFFVRAFRETDGKVRRNIGKAIIGAFVLGSGIGLSADLVVQMGGQFLIALGLLIQLAGMILMGLSFYGIRSTDEFLWHSEVQSLFVIFNSLCIYAYSIEQDTALKEADLYGGGLASVLIVAQSIVKSEEPPEHIEYQNLNFLVRVGKQNFAGSQVIVVLLVKKNLSILNEKLERYLFAFEDQFKDILGNWTGDISSFTEKSGDLLQIFRVQQEGNM